MSLTHEHPRAHAAWKNLRARCHHPGHRDYARYGGRGCRVGWESFGAFLADVGDPPSNRHRFVLFSPDGHFEPGGCGWKTATEQVIVRADAKPVTWRGETLPLTAWAKRLKAEGRPIPLSTLHDRIHGLGWDPERALTELPDAAAPVKAEYLAPPAYRRRRDGRAYTRLCFPGQKPRYVTLRGKYNSKRSRQHFERAVAEWKAVAVTQTAKPKTGALSIEELADAFNQQHLKVDKSRSERAAYWCALRVLLRLYADEPAATFGPLKLKAVQHEMGRQTFRGRLWVRDSVNRQVWRLTQMFRWAGNNELIPLDVFRALTELPGLRRGKGGREAVPVQAVPAEVVAATVPHLAPPAAAIVRLCWLVGARAGEMVALTRGDVNVADPDWLTKVFFKGQERRIYFGPQSKPILQPFLDAAGDDPRAYLFRAPRARTRLHYSEGHLGQSIRRVCRRHGVPHWAPHALRHAKGTALREEFGAVEGLIMANALLGHADLSTTQIYAAKCEELARKVARETA